MFTENSHAKFQCINCDYYTSKKFDYDKHLITSKHKNNTNCLPQIVKIANKCSCVCGKEYSCKQSLYVHKKICNFCNTFDNTENIIINESSEIKILTNLVLEVV